MKFGYIYIISIVLVILCSPALSAQAPTGVYKLRKVVIDAGHGGHDPGVVGKKSKEKDIVLSIALKVGALIRTNHPEVEIVYTRNDDVFVPVRERSTVANKCNADLFISIHANSVSNRRHTHVGGAETFVMGVDDSDRNMEVAKRENAVITYEEDYTAKYEGYDPHSPESFIIFSLMQNVHLEQSILLASMVQDAIIADTPVKNNRGVRQEPFLVLWHTTMPSILIEVGFLSNPEEEALLMKNTTQDAFAKSIAKAFAGYKEHYERAHKINGTTVAQATAKPVTSFVKQTAAADAAKPSLTATDNLPANSPSSTPAAVKENTEEPQEENGVKTEFYAVQIFAVSSKKNANDPVLATLENIHFFPEGKLFRYTAGEYDTSQQAEAARTLLRKKYPHAFVVKIQNGKPVK